MSIPETTPAPVVVAISREERDFVHTVLLDMFPRLGSLSRDALVGDNDACTIWTTQIEAVLVADLQAEERLANGRRKDHSAQGIPAWMTYKQANALRGRVEGFRKKLETIRADAAKVRAERDAKRKAKPNAEAAAGSDPAANPDSASERATG